MSQAEFAALVTETRTAHLKAVAAIQAAQDAHVRSQALRRRLIAASSLQAYRDNLVK